MNPVTKVFLNVLGILAGAGGVVTFLPAKYQPVALSVVGLAGTLIALFQHPPTSGQPPIAIPDPKAKPCVVLALIALVLALLVSGCATLLGLPKIESKDLPAVMEELGKDNADICLWSGLRGGSAAAAGTPTPIIPLAGGYGSGEILLGRVNSPNTELTLANGSCTIKRACPDCIMPPPAPTPSPGP